ncbi:Lactoylglutathione lyase, partial [hydrothermal vent metagenome]
MIKFGYTIVYVSDVKSALEFYKKSFGFDCRFLHESGDYGELETGST